MNLGFLRPKLLWIMSWILHYFWILPFCVGTIITVVETEQTLSFEWNTSNPKFSEKDGAKLSIPVGSNLKVICPQRNNTSADSLYYVIYWVSEEGFKKCFKPHNDSSVLVVCNRPEVSFDFTVEISIFTGTPNGKDFKVGHSYYIASFSTGTLQGLGNEYDGACKDKNMRINMTVVNQQFPTTQAPSKTTPIVTTSRPDTPNTTVLSSTQPSPSTALPTTHLFTTATTVGSSTGRTSTNIPEVTGNTDSVINVPDNGNTGVIDLTNRAPAGPVPTLVLTACLSVLHILYSQSPLDQR